MALSCAPGTAGVAGLAPALSAAKAHPPPGLSHRGWQASVVPGPHGPLLTWPEDGQGAVLVQPGQRRPVQFFQAAGGHHPLERLKQRLDDDTELHGTWVKENISEEEDWQTHNRGRGG